MVRYNDALTRPGAEVPDGILGQVDFAGENPASGERGMNAPKGLATDSSGYLWVADTGNHRVLGFLNAGLKENGAPADRLLGQPTWTNSGSGIGPTRLTSPASLAVGTAGTLWICDTNRILRFSTPALKPLGAPADGVLGTLDFYGTPLPEYLDNFNPLGVATGSGDRIYILRQYRGNHIDRYDNASSKPNGAPPDGFFSSAWTQEDLATNLAEGAGDRLWLCTEGTVRRFESSSTLSGEVIPDSVLGDSSVERTDARRLRESVAVVQHAQSGKVFVVDRELHRVLRFANANSLNSGAAAEAVFGQPGFGPLTGPDAPGRLRSPSGCAIDAAGNLWVSDSFKNRVVQFSDAVNAPTGTQPSRVLGQPDLNSTSSRPASEFSIRNPGPLALDSAGRLWVTERGLDWKILRFDDPSNAANGAAASGQVGRVDFYDTGTANPYLAAPQAIACDSSGRLWILGRQNENLLRLLRYDAAASVTNRLTPDASVLIDIHKLSGLPHPASPWFECLFCPSLMVNADDSLTLGSYTGTINAKFRSATSYLDFHFYILKLANPAGLPAEINDPSQISGVFRLGKRFGVTTDFPNDSTTMLFPDPQDPDRFWFADRKDQVRRYDLNLTRPEEDAAVVIVEPSPNPAAPGLQLRMKTQPGVTYRLFSSTDLATWTGGEVLLATGAETAFSVPLAEKAKYFRAVRQD